MVVLMLMCRRLAKQAISLVFPEVLEQGGSADIICFDKTGTLTGSLVTCLLCLCVFLTQAALDNLFQSCEPSEAQADLKLRTAALTKDSISRHRCLQSMSGSIPSTGIAFPCLPA